MLGDRNAVTNLAVKDLATARKFYADTLGLEQVAAEGEELLVYRSGSSKIFVYRSEYAGTNKATALTWEAGGEMEDIVRELKGKGVTFEHYEMPGMTLEGDIHVAEDMKIVWFKDPDGNILSIANGG